MIRRDDRTSRSVRSVPATRPLTRRSLASDPVADDAATATATSNRRRVPAAAFAWTQILDRRRPAFGGTRSAEPPTAQLADCSCPEFCERDHEND